MEFHVDRRSYFSQCQNHELGSDFEETLYDYESGSPTFREESFQKLLNKINTEFSCNEKASPKQLGLKYDFHKAYRYFYFNHNYDLRIRSPNDFYKDERKSSLSDNSSKKCLDRSCQEYDNRGDIKDEQRTSSCYKNEYCSDKCDFELSPVWCMDYQDNLIVIGCASGRLEFWDGTTGSLQVNYLLRGKFS